MRVIGGSARGRRIEAPPGRGTRPITDRAKEAVFNMLAGLGVLHDEARVLDLYAGSGSFGIESLSRGVAEATFVEMDRMAARVLQANIDSLGFSDQATVLQQSVERALAVLNQDTFQVAFCDPPYALDPWEMLFATLPTTLIVGHADHDISLPEPWTELKRRRYGRSRIVIAERAGGTLP